MIEIGLLAKGMKAKVFQMSFQVLALVLGADFALLIQQVASLTGNHKVFHWMFLPQNMELGIA